MSNGAWWRLVRFGFRLLYNEMAWSYDSVSWVVSLGLWKRWTLTSLDYLPDHTQRVVELAHGTGTVQMALCERGIGHVGVDLSPYMGRIAARKLGKAGCPAPLTRGNAFRLPLKANSADAVVTTFPTPFFLEEVALAEVRRVLRDEGRYIVVPAATLDLTGVAPRFLEFLYRITGQREDMLQPFTERLAAQGFRVETHTQRVKQSKVWVMVAEKRR